MSRWKILICLIVVFVVSLARNVWNLGEVGFGVYFSEFRIGVIEASCLLPVSCFLLALPCFSLLLCSLKLRSFLYTHYTLDCLVRSLEPSIFDHPEQPPQKWPKCLILKLNLRWLFCDSEIFMSCPLLLCMLEFLTYWDKTRKTLP